MTTQKAPGTMGTEGYQVTDSIPTAREDDNPTQGAHIPLDPDNEARCAAALDDRKTGKQGGGQTRDSTIYRDLTKVKVVRTHWVYKELVPAETLTLLAGPSGIGKSTLTLAAIAKITRGTAPGDYADTPANVLLYAPEDSDSMLRARLEAAGADIARVIPVAKSQPVALVDGTATAEAPFSLPADSVQLEQAIIDKHPAVMVIDPITNFIDGDTNKLQDVRAALNALQAIAKRHNVAIVGVMHFNKGAGKPSDKVSGSHAFRDACRSLLTVAKFEQGEDAGTSVLTIDKSNYGVVEGTSYEYEIVPHWSHDDNGEHMSVGKVSGWKQTTTSVVDVIDANYAPKADKPMSKPDECEADIVAYLKACGGSAHKSDIVDEFAHKAKGETWSRTQLEHAFTQSGRINSERENEFHSRTKWILVDDSTQTIGARGGGGGLNPKISESS